jgi:type IV secretory pathway ATPase VirB11/archaellum biosynthesis ATPase
VSTLKRSHFGASAGDDDATKGLGIEKGTFKWNEVEEKDDGTAKTPESIALTPTDDAVQGANDGTERGSITGSEASNHRFELRDVDIVFPERQLTVVTGPTASGKTALLVSIGRVLSSKGRAVLMRTLLDGFARGNDDTQRKNYHVKALVPCR